MRRAIKAHSALLQSFAHSQKAITGCSCKHFAPQHSSWYVQSKRIATISLYHRGRTREYTLQAEYSGEGRIHRIVHGTVFVQKSARKATLKNSLSLCCWCAIPMQSLCLWASQQLFVFVFKRHTRTQKKQSFEVCFQVFLWCVSFWNEPISTISVTIYI